MFLPSRKNVLFIFLLHTVLAGWQTLNSATITMPPYVYPIKLDQGQNFQVKLTSFGSFTYTIAIYVYMQGSNLMSDEGYEKLLTSKNKTISLSYICKKSSNYYIRVGAIDNSLNKQLISYNVKLISQKDMREYNGILYNSFNTGYAAVIRGSLSFENLGLIYQQNTSIKTKAILTAFNYQAIQLNQNETLCRTNISTPNQLILIIELLVVNLYSLQPVNFKVKYFPDYSCPSANLKFILVLIFSILFPILVIIAIFLLYRRYYRYFKQESSQVNNVDALESMKDLNIKNQESCCICLCQVCDTRLPCHHSFHKECIKKWFKKNNACPVCRQQIVKLALKQAKKLNRL